MRNEQNVLRTRGGKSRWVQVRQHNQASNATALKKSPTGNCGTRSIDRTHPARIESIYRGPGMHVCIRKSAEVRGKRISILLNFQEVFCSVVVTTGVTFNVLPLERVDYGPFFASLMQAVDSLLLQLGRPAELQPFTRHGS
jgi:hypothetical protein